MKSVWIPLMLCVGLMQPLKAQNMKSEILKFPKGFLWGAASAAYQVEGGTKADEGDPISGTSTLILLIVLLK